MAPADLFVSGDAPVEIRCKGSAKNRQSPDKLSEDAKNVLFVVFSAQSTVRNIRMLCHVSVIIKFVTRHFYFLPTLYNLLFVLSKIEGDTIIGIVFDWMGSIECFKY